MFPTLTKKTLSAVVAKKIVSAVVVGLAVAAAPAFAADAPASSVAQLWASISFVDTIAAIFGIGSLVISVDLAQLGYHKVRKLITGSR